MKKIGLVGGISWVSTMDYYRYINEGVNAKLGGLQFAECVIYSLNFADIQAKSWENAYSLLFNACEDLKRADVKAIALCANTAHMYAEELQAQIGLPLIHIVSETAKAIQAQGISTVGLLGTQFTMEMPFYREKLEAYGLKALIPERQETRDYIQQTLEEELGKGVILSKTKQNYIDIAEDLIQRGAEGIILGCTEIPLLLSQNDFSVPIFDTTKIHAEAIVGFIVA